MAGNVAEPSGSWGGGAGSEGALRDHRHSTKTALCFLHQTFPPLPGAAELITAHKASCIYFIFTLYPFPPCSNSKYRGKLKKKPQQLR